MERREFLLSASMGLTASLSRATLGAALGLTASGSNSVPVSIDLGKKTGALPHFWENCAGSDRTVVGLREQWRSDLVRAHRSTGIKSVRCHGLFDDEMGIAARGAGKYNFMYLDQVYDFMLDNGVRPFVELSFMPEALASSNNTIFSYRGNASPPVRWQDWFDLVNAFTTHCVRRYGIAEVSRWQFEVWNEPNIAFWAGTQEQYFELYRQSVLAVKAVDKRLRVGGPSTAQLDWVPDLINFCATHSVPIDFITSHVYPGDPQQRIFGRDNAYRFEEVIPRGIDVVNQQIQSSAMPDLPLLITEWSSQNPAFIAQTIKECIGKVDTLSYWTFSNVFEEGGVPSGPFNEGFGMLGPWSIARPSLHAFTFLHKLGDTRLDAGDGPVLATGRADGSVAILAWNLIPAAARADVANGNPVGANTGALGGSGSARRLQLELKGLRGRKRVLVSQITEELGSAVPAWKAMGSPEYPSREQISQLRVAAELGEPTLHVLSSGDSASVTVDLPGNGLALIELES
jgi:xylan 1,4-beta-xylosidase